ncbi:MAG TPA: hypothetical protein VE093_27480 [Polyangiaceae bacterium]|nr:hypothetical protein [Polyangiaceae bacterium]
MSTSRPPPAPVDEHPALAAARRAPLGKPLPPELRAQLDQQLADIKAGRARLVPHEDLPAALEELWRAEHPDEPSP